MNKRLLLILLLFFVPNHTFACTVTNTVAITLGILSLIINIVAIIFVCAAFILFIRYCMESSYKRKIRILLLALLSLVFAAVAFGVSRYSDYHRKSIGFMDCESIPYREIYD